MDNRIFYVENPKDSNKTLQELIHESVKSQDIKINCRKFVAFLYTNNKTVEKEINPICNVPETIRYLGINLTKEVKDL